MQTIERMISTSPVKSAGSTTGLPACISACIECMQACVACADACLAEARVEKLRRCIRLNQDCADICGVTSLVLTRLSEADPGVLRAQLEACALTCATCGAECQHHAHQHEHCKVCAEACHRCEDACRQVLRALGAAKD